jgi:hypothetical protein
MAGLVPAIHVLGLAKEQGVDARDTRGHDAEIASRFHAIEHAAPVSILPREGSAREGSQPWL